MKFRLHFVYDATTVLEESMVIEAETIEELRKIADREVKKRNPQVYWSEEIK